MTMRTRRRLGGPALDMGDHAAAARFTVWKGVDALRRGDPGGDVDVMVHPDDVDLFVDAMRTWGMVRAVEGAGHRDDHVLSLLGVGPDGDLVHVDAATAFVLARPPWRTRVLDIAARVVDGSRVDADLGLPVTSPDVEAALRLLEWAHLPPLVPRTRRRRKWGRVDRALAATTPDAVARAMADLAGAAAGDAVAGLVAGPSRTGRGALRDAVAPRLQREQLGSAGVRLVTVAWSRLLAALGRAGVPRRALAGGGRIVAVVGADGAGKSTLVRTLADSLAPKVAVVTIYFGSGDGPASWYRAPLRCGRRLVGDRVSRASTGTDDDRRGGLAVLALVVWACALAVEKVQKARRAERARARGHLVLSDRFPQVQFPGANDGPLLAAWRDHPAAGRRWLARWEDERYRRALATVPDLVLSLRVDLATARTRRPFHDPEDLADRIDRIERLDFGAPTRRIDATDAPDEVRASALREVLSLAIRT